MARDQIEDYQGLEQDDEQPVSAAACDLLIPSMSLALVPPCPHVRVESRLHRFDRFFLENALLPFLDKSDISVLSLVSKTTQRLFQPNRLQMIADLVLLLVMRGEQTKAEIIFKNCPDLLLIKGTATDYSGRKFHCTAFQYALWALDTRYMCQMMLDCLPCSPVGENIKQVLLRHLLIQEFYGIEYQLKSKTVIEKHHDFTALLKALETYLKANSMRTEMTRQWQRVGLAQRYVPAHVAQHYCDPDERFHPTTKFNKAKFDRVLLVHHYSLIQPETWMGDYIDKPKPWFPLVGFSRFLGLSGDAGFGITGYGWSDSPLGGRSTVGLSAARKTDARNDFDALIALHKVRTQDLELLKERLQSPLQIPKAEAEPVLSCVIS